MLRFIDFIKFSDKNLFSDIDTHDRCYFCNSFAVGRHMMTLYKIDGEHKQGYVFDAILHNNRVEEVLAKSLILHR